MESWEGAQGKGPPRLEWMPLRVTPNARKTPSTRPLQPVLRIVVPGFNLFL